MCRTPVVSVVRSPVGHIPFPMFVWQVLHYLVPMFVLPGTNEYLPGGVVCDLYNSFSGFAGSLFPLTAGRRDRNDVFDKMYARVFVLQC